MFTEVSSGIRGVRRRVADPAREGLLEGRVHEPPRAQPGLGVVQRVAGVVDDMLLITCLSSYYMAASHYFPRSYMFHVPSHSLFLSIHRMYICRWFPED